MAYIGTNICGAAAIIAGVKTGSITYMGGAVAGWAGGAVAGLVEEGLLEADLLAEGFFEEGLLLVDL